LSDTQK